MLSVALCQLDDRPLGHGDVGELRAGLHSAEASDNAEYHRRGHPRRGAADDGLDRGDRLAGDAGVALFGILFVWQVPHFLAIATLYREDYRRGGFRMLPVDDPELRRTGRQILLYSAAMFPVSLLPVMAGVAGRAYTVSAVVLGVIFFAFALSCANRRSRAEARKLFFASIIYLPVLLAILMMDQV